MPHKNQSYQLFAQAQLTNLDRIKLQKMVKKQIDEQAPSAAFIQALTEAQMRYQTRQNALPGQIDYPSQLPVVDKKAELYAAIRDHQVVIIAGETGSGKTTQIPKICLELGRGVKGYIGHTQPRRLAARSVASRLAQELQSELGSLVGYKVRFSDHVAEDTLVKLMTDGILLAEIQHDRLLQQYDTIIIDEAHERSLNIDFILGYLKQILPRRPDLKVIITSATIDPQRFANHFNQAPIIEVSGRTYPVEVRYRPLGTQDNADQLQGIINAVDELSHEAPGDILVFLSGEREIRDAADALSKLNLRHTEILPLYARLSAAEQNRIFQPSAMLRRIILATNVAETSLTVPGIKYVIDTGLARISRYSYRTKVQRLPIEPISQASANQRKGRCGRTSDGICIRLYDEQDFLSRPEFTDPEILRTNLASVILQMMALGLGNIEAFPFVEPPDCRHIQDGLRLLEELGATQLQQRNYQLTPLGKTLSQLPLDPRLARMIIAAQTLGCVKEIMIITAALSIQDPRERPLDKQQAADEKHRRFSDEQSDFLSIINLWRYIETEQQQLSSNQFRKRCRQEFLNYLRIREWQDVYTQLRQTVKLLQIPINQLAADYRAIHCALLSGLLSQIGMKEHDKHEYLGARNIKFALFPNSALFKKPPKWCVVAELVETTRLWGRVAARIEPEWLEALAKHLTKASYSEPHWSKRQGVAMASEKVTLFGLPIVAGRLVNYSRIDPALSRELFIRHALVQGEWQTRYPFYQQNRHLLAEVEELEHKSRRRDILVDEQQLFDFYDQRVGRQVVSVRHFNSWWHKISHTQPELLNFEKQMLVKQDALPVSQLDYPDFWQQGELKLPLSYQFEPGTEADGVTVHIPLSVLNQVQEQGFDWQVPGLRMELVTTLIKLLPKSLRRNFVPAPNYAAAFLERVQPGNNSLVNSLSHELRKMTGVTVAAEQWPIEQLPVHLRISFRIVDPQGKKIAEGKQLAELKAALSEQMQQVMASLGQQQQQFGRQHLTDWQFGELPKTYQQQQGQFTVQAYPALIDNGQDVSLQLVDNPQTQQQQTALGLRRLLLLNMPSPIKYLHEKLPNKAKLSLYFTPFGTVQSLIDDCIACGIDYLIQQHGGIVWQQAAFEQLLMQVKAESNQIVVQVAQKVEQILTLHFQIQKRLKGRIDLALAFALSDIKAQLEHLIYKGFVSNSGYQRLDDIIRYLKAIERRIEKLLSDPARDRANMHKIEQVQQAYQQLLAKLPPELQLSDEVVAIRWMIEELRVNLFAQQLGTPYPISEKRIMQQIETIKRQR